jgi:hypothetical protein
MSNGFSIADKTRTDAPEIRPVCAYCGAERDSENRWQPSPTPPTPSADLKLTHGVCPTCLEQVVKPELARLEVRVRDRKRAAGSGAS